MRHIISETLLFKMNEKPEWVAALKYPNLQIGPAGDVIIFRPFLKCGRKLIHSKGSNPTFFRPDVCQLIMSNIRLNRTLSELENFLSLSYNKFAVEWDWNSKLSQNIRNLGLYWKIRWVFSKEKRFFFQNRQNWQVCIRIHVERSDFFKLTWI